MNLVELERELAAAQEKLDYAKNHGLHIGRMVTADRPEGFLAHEYVKGSTLARMFDEWSESIGLDSQLSEVTKQRDALADALRALKELGPPSKAKDIITTALTTLEGRTE